MPSLHSRRLLAAQLARRFLRRSWPALQAHGWSAALPGYSLAPEVKLGDIVAEIRAALDWLKAEGPKHGIAGPVILSGWSAGGHLTAMALDHPLVVAGFAMSGVYDLEALRDTKLNPPLQLTDGEIAALSPLRLPVVNKPMTIAYGTAELPTLVNDSRNLHAMRAAAHAPGVLLPVDACQSLQHSRTTCRSRG